MEPESVLASVQVLPGVIGMLRIGSARYLKVSGVCPFPMPASHKFWVVLLGNDTPAHPSSRSKLQTLPEGYTARIPPSTLRTY